MVIRNKTHIHRWQLELYMAFVLKTMSTLTLIICSMVLETSKMRNIHDWVEHLSFSLLMRRAIVGLTIVGWAIFG